MKTCKTCGQQLLDEPKKTVVINGIEYETESHDFNKKLSDITISKGWRLWKASDFENFSLKDWDTLSLKSAWFFIQYPFVYNPNNYVARFDANSVRAGLSCGRYPAGSNSGLGVRFCREKIRKVKK